MTDEKHAPRSAMGAYKAIEEAFETLDRTDAAQRTGAEYDAQTDQFRIRYLGQNAIVNAKDCTVVWEYPDHTSHMDNQILMHHIIFATANPQLGERMSLFELARSAGWAQRIIKSCAPPLAKMFGHDLPLFFECVQKMGGEAISKDTASIPALPQIPMYITIQPVDEEFPADAVLLVDKTLPQQLPGEDILVLPQLMVFELLRVSGKPFDMPLGEFRK